MLIVQTVCVHSFVQKPVIYTHQCYQIIITLHFYLTNLKKLMYTTNIFTIYIKGEIQLKSKFLKKALITLSALVIICLIAVTTYIVNDRKMLPATETSSVSVVPQSIENYDNLKIAIIGDSWVAGEKLDAAIEEEILSYGINSDVVSYGHPGANSNQILYNLISDGTNPNSSNSLLSDESIQYVFVIAGVNDTAGHMGANYFTHHMIEIVNVLNQHNKIPVILEIPEYGIEEPEIFKSALKHNLYKILFDNNETNVLSTYRKSLVNELESTNLTYHILPIDPLLYDYHKQLELYRENDQFHLNSEGNYKLGTYMGNYLYETVIQ